MPNSEQVAEKAVSNDISNVIHPSPPDPNLVTWNENDDPGYPKNWTTSRKWRTLLPMSLFNFLASMSSATMAPALSAIQRDLHFKSETNLILSLSIFLLGTAIVPLFTAPLSEVFGRSAVLQSCNIFYVVFNALCGVAKTPNQLITYRFLAGLGGAGPFAIGSGINADLFRPHERGKAIGVYVFAPLIGVAIGPITGGFLVQYTSWPWCFYVVSIAGATVQILGIPLFHETFPPVLLQKRCRQLRKSTQNPNLYTEHDNLSLAQLFRASVTRPFKLLATQPIVQVWSLYCAYLYGILYLLIATFPNVWTDTYGESISIESLNYLSLFIGMGFASQLGTRLADKYYRKLCEKNGGRGLPEFRLPVLMNIGAAIFGAGVVLELLCVMIDTYQKYAASAMAAVICLRSILSCVLPLAAPSLYANLGFGWGNTLLAFIAIGVGIPGPVLLQRYGPALRKRSQYARDI